MVRKLVTTLLAALLLVGAAGSGALAAQKGNQGQGQESPIVADAIYADGRLFGTILLGDLPFNDNAHSFDKLFMIEGQPAVAEAAPGPGYSGGRWLPVAVTWNTEPYLLTSYAAVQAAASAGDVSLGAPQHDDAFLCPLIPGRPR